MSFIKSNQAIYTHNVQTFIDFDQGNPIPGTYPKEIPKLWENTCFKVVIKKKNFYKDFNDMQKYL